MAFMISVLLFFIRKRFISSDKYRYFFCQIYKAGGEHVNNTIVHNSGSSVVNSDENFSRRCEVFADIF